MILVVYTTSEQFPDLPCRVGPFYLCSDKCREAYEAWLKSKGEKMVVYGDVSKPANYGCDNCGK
jgi:hypothetical protein